MHDTCMVHAWCVLGMHLPRPSVGALARALHEAAQPRCRVRLVGELADHLPNRETVAGEAPGVAKRGGLGGRGDLGLGDLGQATTRAPPHRPFGTRAARALLADPGVAPSTRAGF